MEADRDIFIRTDQAADEIEHQPGKTEREAKKNGAYVILTYACDWSAGFFFRNRYTVRGELADYPKGHHAYELEKRF